MRDVVIGTAESVAREWREEAERRRGISATDPVADTLAFCAGELTARVRAVTFVTKDALTAEQYGARCDPKVTAQTVRQWCRRGLVPAQLTGNGWMVRADAPRPGTAAEKKSA